MDAKFRFTKIDFFFKLCKLKTWDSLKKNLKTVTSDMIIIYTWCIQIYLFCSKVAYHNRRVAILLKEERKAVQNQKLLAVNCKHGLRTPNEVFFHWNTELLGLSRQIEPINSGVFGVFSGKISALILVQWVSCPCFPFLNYYFYKKLSLYIHIQSYIFQVL